MLKQKSLRWENNKIFKYSFLTGYYIGQKPTL